jgi:hypothetical protein
MSNDDRDPWEILIEYMNLTKDIENLKKEAEAIEERLEVLNGQKVILELEGTMWKNDVEDETHNE